MSIILAKLWQKISFFYHAKLVINYLKACSCIKIDFTAKIRLKESKKPFFGSKFCEMVSLTQFFGNVGTIKVKILMFLTLKLTTRLK